MTHIPPVCYKLKMFFNKMFFLWTRCLSVLLCRSHEWITSRIFIVSFTRLGSEKRRCDGFIYSLSDLIYLKTSYDLYASVPMWPFVIFYRQKIILEISFCSRKKWNKKPTVQIFHFFLFKEVQHVVIRCIKKDIDVLLENRLLLSVAPPDFWNQLQGFCSRSAARVVSSVQHGFGSGSSQTGPETPRRRLTVLSLHDKLWLYHTSLNTNQQQKETTRMKLKHCWINML